MKICIHAGHNPDGKVACGAVGFGKESTIAREVCAYLPEYLTAYQGVNAVINVTCNDGKNARDVLNRIIRKTNEQNPDLSVSVHLNASEKADANGCEVWCYEGNKAMFTLAVYICKELEKYGYYYRGAKPSKKLAVLRKVDKC